jgi:hypothetical protein
MPEARVVVTDVNFHRDEMKIVQQLELEVVILVIRPSTFTIPLCKDSAHWPPSRR